MPRKPLGVKPMTAQLPVTLCSLKMRQLVDRAARNLDTKPSVIIRICVAHVLQEPHENSDYVVRKLREAANNGGGR